MALWILAKEHEGSVCTSSDAVTLGVMQSKATTVEQYLAELPEDRRAAISAVREVILKNLDKDYSEGMSYGMIGYFVPHGVYPPGYHCDPKMPLPYAGLASQKNHMSLYLMSVYCNCAGGEAVEGDPADAHSRWFMDAWRATGRKLDMGKCCIRFKRLEQVALDVVGEAIRRVPAKKFIEHYESAILTSNTKAAARRSTSSAAKSEKKPAPTARKKVTKKAGKKAAGPGAKTVQKKADARRVGMGRKKAGKKTARRR